MLIRIRRRPRLLALVQVLVAVLVAMTLAAPSARADGPLVGTDERFREALAHYDRGKAAFQNGDHVAAAVEFAQAHELFAPLARDRDGAAGDPSAKAWDRTALTDEATAYARADLPVEAFDAFSQLKASFAAELGAERIAAIDQALEQLTSRIGTLELRGVPSDTEVRVDGVLVAKADKPFRIAAGQHPIEIRGTRYKTFATRATVAPKQAAVVDVKMEISDVLARLRVETAIPFAFVSIDDGEAVRLPLERTIAPGQHTFKVTSEGYRESSGTFEADPGERSVVRVSLVPNRTPLGLRLEPVFLFSAPLRGDTPFNNGVDPGEDYADGYGLAAGGGLRIFYDFARSRALSVGAVFEWNQRPLNKGAFGVIVDFSPDALSWSNGDARWCPISLAFLLPVVGGSVDRFTGGETALRLGTKLERHFGLFYFHFGGGFGYETYKRNALANLSVATAYGAVGMGVDL